MLDREVATAALGKALGMDHIPEISVRKEQVDNANGEQLGLVVGDIVKDFKKDDTKQIVKGAESPLLQLKATRTDPKIGDKAMFDYLIGNLDRHQNNYFLRENGNGSVDFLGFDHGLSFPSTNKSMEKY